ncbi:DUF3383 domain-containing protein [Pandoraea apista]|uniref:DUF3383 domain-containing protein n=1 Tax=Pandoraea apista TaxID=93218 RepID=UPI002F94307E
MNSIPASQLVSVNPGVVGTGGSPLSLNSVFLTQDASIPVGVVQPFPTAKSVEDWFGATSPEAALADVYFLGFDNSNLKPGTLFFAQYPTAPVSAYLRGGSLNGMTLAQLKALTGTLSVTMDGTVKTSSAINLSAATSFSNAATIIAGAFTAGPAVTFDSQRQAFVLTSTTTGAASSMSAGSGTIAASLLLTSATGAVTSQGAIASVPASFMGAVTQVTQNWATFMTVWEPVLADKMAFAAWSNAQNQRYAYVGWDSDVTATQAGNTTAFGPQVLAANYDGVIPVYPSSDKAAFVCGAAASIDFSQKNGRITFAYKGQSGLTPDVTDATVAANLIANGYNFYGSYATANQQFSLFQPGSMPGKWKWIDAYINQIYLNSQLQLALMTLLQNTKSLPYNAVGYGLISAACQDPINEGLNFGSIRTGIPLSAQQAASLNMAAGLPIDQSITSQGYYLQVLPATAQVRGLRKSPPCSLWYADGGSIHKIDLASIDVM